MKIYTNNNYEIVALDVEPASYGYCFEVERTKEDIFGDWCDVCIQGYKYEPQCELLFNEDGSNARNEKTGELLYKLDDEGNKIQSGYSCYPYIDYQTLILIQKQYEESQRHVHALNAKVAYMSMMSGYEMEV